MRTITLVTTTVLAGLVVAGCSSKTTRDLGDGTGGTGGTGGWGPIGGTGATGGIIDRTGGTGGTMGGTGGYGGITPIGGTGGVLPGQCGMGFSDDVTCQDCLDLQCCDQESACFHDPNCIALLDCIAACGPYAPGCADNCVLNDYTTAPSELFAVFDCESTQCPVCTPGSYLINVVVSGLVAPISFTLRNTGDTIVAAGDGMYSFPTSVVGTTLYQVDVASNPQSQCVVRNAIGYVPTHDVTVWVDCRSDLQLSTGSGAGTYAYDYRGMPAVQLSDGSVVGSHSLSYGHALFKAYNGSSLDTAFGTSGAAQYYSGLSGTGPVFLGVMPDGALQLVAAGSSTYRVVASYRYTTAGQLDTAYGTSGVASLDWYGGIGDTIPTAAALRYDGYLYVAADVYNGSYYQAGIARVDTAGNLNPEWGGGGALLLSRPGYHVSALAAEGDSLLVAGADLQGGDCDYYTDGCDVLVRLASDGSLDPTFDSSGAAQAFQVISRLLLMSDGTIAASGYAAGYSMAPVVARLGSEGSFIGSARSAPLPYLDTAPSSVYYPPVLGEDGQSRLVVGGNLAETGGIGTESMYVTRFNYDMTYDTSFNETGAVSVRYSLGSTTQNWEQAVMGLLRSPSGGVWLLGAVGQGGGSLSPVLTELM